MLDVLYALVKAVESREPVVLATVIDVRGASPAQVGFKRL
jgi:xanthine/CO dehydrogenase XdhC/CoxF family maturation factor